MRVLVCGGRNFGVVRCSIKAALGSGRAYEKANAEELLLNRTLSSIPGGFTIIHGAGTGADALAQRWAERVGLPDEAYPAKWYPNGRAGGLDRSAGPKRNQRMIDEGKPDLVVAFPGGRGTADMVARARAAGIEVREIGATRPAGTDGEQAEA